MKTLNTYYQSVEGSRNSFNSSTEGFFSKKSFCVKKILNVCENANEHFRLEMKLDKTHFSPKRFGIFLTMVDVNLALTVELGYSTKILLEC